MDALTRDVESDNVGAKRTVGLRDRLVERTRADRERVGDRERSGRKHRLRREDNEKQTGTFMIHISCTGMREWKFQEINSARRRQLEAERRRKNRKLRVEKIFPIKR